MPVVIRHPAPMRYVPRGGRIERLGFVPTATPVEIPGIGASGFDEVGRIRLGADRGYQRKALVRDRLLYARDGGVWVGLRDNANAPLGPRALVDFLTGAEEISREDERDLVRHFVRTPVLALPSGYVGVRGDVEPTRIRGVVADGTDRARADLARMLADDVAVVGDEVRVRLRSMVCDVCHPSYANGGDPIVVRPALFPRGNYHPHRAWRLDRPTEYVDYLTRHRLLARNPNQTVGLPRGECVETYLGLVGDGRFPFRLTRGGEVALFVNASHGHLLELTVMQEMSKLDGLSVPALHALDRSRGWAMLGAMSAIRPGEYAACLDDLRTLALEARAAHTRAANSGSIDRLMTALDEAVLPAWHQLPGGTADAAATEEDEASLGGLVP